MRDVVDDGEEMGTDTGSSAGLEMDARGERGDDVPGERSKELWEA